MFQFSSLTFLECVCISNFPRGRSTQPNAELSISVSKTELIGNKRLLLHKLLLLSFNGIKYLNKVYSALKVKVKVAQSCLTLCDPMDYTVHGILQARILEWVAFPFCRGSSQPRSPTLQADSLLSESPRKPTVLWSIELMGSMNLQYMIK